MRHPIVSFSVERLTGAPCMRPVQIKKRTEAGSRLANEACARKTVMRISTIRDGLSTGHSSTYCDLHGRDELRELINEILTEKIDEDTRSA